MLLAIYQGYLDKNIYGAVVPVRKECFHGGDQESNMRLKSQPYQQINHAHGHKSLKGILFSQFKLCWKFPYMSTFPFLCVLGVAAIFLGYEASD